MASRAAGAVSPDVEKIRLDSWLLGSWIALIAIGMIMVMSASIGYAASIGSDPLYFFKKHMVFVAAGMLVVWIILQIPIRVWYQLAPLALIASLVLLAVVLIPGIGIETNGARRWLGFGGFTLQVAEFAKAALILFLSAYLVRHGDSLREHWLGMTKPLAIMALYLLLLLAQPDFGSLVVMAGITVTLVFLAGIHFFKFMAMALLGVAALAFFALSSDYRKQRLTGFMDPWADQFDSGYQLIQSLIAFGRGEWVGVGLGNSLQKLLYLPEAHTDFVFAVIAEETGLVGSFVVIALLAVLVGRLFSLGMRAVNSGQTFGGFVALGTATMFAIQALINIGVACGLLPTKGLTLPFISAGGSSLLVCMALTGICMRLSWEMARDEQALLRGEVKV